MKEICSELKKRNLWAARMARGLFSVGCVVGLAVGAGTGLIRTQAQQSFPLPAINPPGAQASPPGAKPSSDASQKAPGSSAQPADAAAAQSNETEVAKQCGDILKLATELKAEVDKSSKDQLSVPVVRKAGEIEQLAHKVRTSTGKD